MKLTPRRALVAGAFAVVLVGSWIGQYGPTPDSDDWAQYLLHAEAVAEGKPYAEINYVFSHYAWGTGPPIAAPGLALTMAPVLAFFGFQNWMHTGFNLVSILLLMVIMFRYFGRTNDRRAATAAVLVAMALILVRGADTLQPDLAFVTLIWGALLLADSVEEWSWARTVGIALLGLWAILYRVAALPLIPAMAVFGVLTWKAHKIKPWLITAVWVLAWAYLHWVVQSGRTPAPAPYIEIPALGVDPTSDTRGLQAMWHNVVGYRLGLFELELYPFARGALNDAYHLLISPLVVFGILVWLEGNWFRWAAIFAAAYLGFLIVVPFGVTRYLWPLWPFAAYGLVTGLDYLLDRIPLDRIPKNGFRSAAFVSAIIAIALVTSASKPFEPTVYRLDSVREIVDYTRSIPADEAPRVVFYLPRSFAWTTGIPTMAMFPAPSNGAILRELEEQGITHVIVGILGDPAHISALERWTATIQSNPDRFVTVLENADFSVYEVVPPPPPR